MSARELRASARSGNRLLASVRDLAEARITLEAGADIIDLKEPAAGALGAVPLSVAREVSAFVAGRVPVSATVGDLPLRAALIAPAVAAMAQTGVDYVKLGMFTEAGGKLDAATTRAAAVELRAARLSACAARYDVKLIAVLFADRIADFAFVDSARALGFGGVMLDTADKSRGRLRDHLSHARLAEFCACARAHDLLVGLAGSLRAEDVDALAPLAPDYFGFRGALCDSDQRTATLSAERIGALARRLRAPPRHFESSRVSAL